MSGRAAGGGKRHSDQIARRTAQQRGRGLGAADLTPLAHVGRAMLLTRDDGGTGVRAHALRGCGVVVCFAWSPGAQGTVTASPDGAWGLLRKQA